MIGNVKKILKNEEGAVQIVEATIVFPIMFIILLFLIYMGNAYYIRSQVEKVVVSYAIQGASYCADPLLEVLETTGSIPKVDDYNTEPYRYIFGGMSDIESQIAKAVKKEIATKTTSFFRNMEPKIKTPESQITQFKNYVVYSTFAVEVEYEIKFPIKILGADSPTVLNVCSRSEVPVTDTAEFIRNTDMVIDLFHGTKIGQAISDVFGKINEFITTFASK